MPTLGRTIPLLLALSFGCGDDRPPPAWHDAGDAEEREDVEDVQDVPDVPTPDARDSSGPPAPWRHEPVITVQSTEPCEDWVPVEALPRGLPADTTPRLLWRFRPENDPRYSGPVAAFYTGVSEPVVSPDGTIWVRGPRAAHVMQLSRDGRMIGWFRPGGADENDELIPARLGPLLPLPDGRVVAAIYTVDGTRGGLSIMNPISSFVPANRAHAGALLVLDRNTKLAAGPGGVVYATGGNKLYATCRGERLMWTLTNELIEPGTGDGSFFYLRVEVDGTVVVSGGAQRVYRVDPTTRNVDASQPIPLEDNQALLLLAKTPSVSMFNFYGDMSNMAVLTSETEVRFAGVVSTALSPLGRIHYWDDVTALALDAPYTQEPTAIPTDGQFAAQSSLWFESGDWVRLTGEGLTRFDREGELTWNVPVGVAEGFLGGEIRALMMDDTGVVYSSLTIGGAPIELAAFQTDGLPPPTSVCVTDGCNAHRDRRLRPAE